MDYVFEYIISWITAPGIREIDIDKITLVSSKYWTSDLFPIYLTSKSDSKKFKIEPQRDRVDEGVNR